MKENLIIITFIVKFIPMIILELLCNPRSASLNHSLASRGRELLLAAGHRVLFHDLYEEGFDPVLDGAELARGTSLDPLVQTYTRELEEAEALLIFHPDWWGGAPALLKGWLDRVLRQGSAYELEGEDFSEKEWKPLLAGKRALVYVTSDSAGGASSPVLEAFWSRLSLGSCGIEAECVVLGNMRKAGHLERSSWIAGLEARLSEKFPAVPRTAGLDGRASASRRSL
jgi:NAD(P)H dehydrogenase (quinone)